MVGARSLAMALNRLIDAGIDARNPRTAGRELPRGRAHALAGRRLLPRLARGVPRRRLPARADRPLALADPGRRVRRLPVPEAGDLALALLARRRGRARAGRRVGGDHERASARGLAARGGGRRLGGRVRRPLRALRPRPRPRARAPLGAGAVRRPGGIRGRPCSATLPRSSSWRSPGSRSVPAFSTGSAWPWSRGCFSTSTRSSRPRDTSRLDLAFFTMNGVISVTFFLFVLADVVV